MSAFSKSSCACATPARRRLAKVRDALVAAAPGRPKTFLPSFAGVWPAAGPRARAGSAAFWTLQGADNLGASRFPSPGGGNVNVEFLLSENPALYITNGLSGPEAKGGLVIGNGVDAQWPARA